MELNIEYKDVQEFSVSLVGVTKINSDGSERQNIIRSMNVAESVKLVREYDNEHDSEAIAVYNLKGEMLGYFPKGDALAFHIDSGGRVSASIKAITGGPTFFEKTIGRNGKNYGCVLLVEKGSFNWDEVTPYMDENKVIEDKISIAKQLEKENAESAIMEYYCVVEKILEMNSRSRISACWRRARYPVNRLSLLLEKNSKYALAYEVITKYLDFKDIIGILASDQESVLKRKVRLEKKLGKNT